MKEIKNIQKNEKNLLLNRRDFIKVTGTGIFIFFTIGDLDLLAQGRGYGSSYPEDFNAYLQIRENGRISCFTGKIEMGQGIITSLAQMLAEELEVELESVDMVMGDTELCPFDFATVGSRSTKYFGPPLRKAAAEARSVLLSLASDALDTAPEKLYCEKGAVMVRINPEKRISYAELARGKKIQRHLKEGEYEIKPHSKHTLSGKPVHRTDARLKVTGKAQYAADITIPGMLYAKILRPPSHDARLKKIDLSAAKKIKDIFIAEEKDLIAALHEIPEEAEKALNLIKAEYDMPDNKLDNENIFKHLEKNAPAGRPVTQKGNIEEGIKNASKRIRSKYLNHYVAHAPIEPHNATAVIENNKAKVWAATQAPFRVQSSVAEALGFETEDVRVFPSFVGGGFGGKTAHQQAVEAAILAKATGKPVQVAWTRKEEFFYDTFRPAAVVNAETGIDRNGKLNFWDFEIILAGTRSSEPIYDIPHQRVVSRGGGFGPDRVHPFPTGAWRGPGSNTNVFAMESQTDIMAQLAGMDPVSFRMKNLSDKRMQRVLKAAAEKFGEPVEKGPGGTGIGVACTNYLGTYVATIAKVNVNNEGNVNVEKVVCAQDMGEIINPQGARLQIEGGITMGISAALTEEIRFKGGTVLTENFDSYEITRFSTAPEIDVVLIDNPEIPPQGCGEPACTTVGAVLANAVCDAIGVRLYELPMTPERIRKAMSKKI